MMKLSDLYIRKDILYVCELRLHPFYDGILIWKLCLELGTFFGTFINIYVMCEKWKYKI